MNVKKQRNIGNKIMEERKIIFSPPDITEEEMDVFKRGRNAKVHSKAKNAGIGDYHNATGYEALLGYLYLKGENERIVELVKLSMEDDEE